MKYLSFLGIDISKKTLFCCLRSHNTTLLRAEIENTTVGITQFFRKISKLVDRRYLLVCAEHTGIYGAHLLNYLKKEQIATWMESGIQIKLSSGLNRGKNDEIDAYRISDYACTQLHKLRLYQFPSEANTRLQTLAKTRERLLKMKGQLKVPLQEQATFLDKKTVQMLEMSIKSALVGLLKSIKKVEEQMSKIINADQTLKRQFELITSISGVGPVTATKVIVYTPGFTKFTCPKKFACYVGTAPFGDQSGSSLKTKPKVSSFAHKKIKALLHLCAMSNLGAKNGNKFKTFYERKIAEGKNKMAVLNAVRNKLIQVIFAVVRTNKPFELSYQY